MQATLPLAIVPPRVSPSLDYTAEQLRARDLFTEWLLTGESMKVIGYAGATKTTTLELLARSTRRRGLYLAFSRSTKEAARSRGPASRATRATPRSPIGRTGSAAGCAALRDCAPRAAVLERFLDVLRAHDFSSPRDPRSCGATRCSR